MSSLCSGCATVVAAAAAAAAHVVAHVAHISARMHQPEWQDGADSNRLASIFAGALQPLVALLLFAAAAGIAAAAVPPLAAGGFYSMDGNGGLVEGNDGSMEKTLV